MNKLKRIVSVILCVCVMTISISSSYTHEVKSAEYVAGVVSAIGGGPILTALLIGGVVVAGGIAIDKIVNSSPEDRANFVNGVKDSFQAFCEETKKGIIMAGNAQISESEARLEASRFAYETVQDFTNNMLNKSVSTGQSLKRETVEYWNDYCAEINDVIDNGISSGGNSGSLNSSSPVFCEINNYTSIECQTYAKDNIYGNCLDFLDNIYVVNGDYYPYNNQTIYSANQNSIPTDRYRFYYTMLWYQQSNRRIVQKLNGVDVNRLNGNIVATSSIYEQQIYYSNNISDIVNTIANNTSMPIVITDDSNYSTTLNSINADYTLIAVSTSIGGSIPLWKSAIKSTLDDTDLGDSIQTGRKQLVNNGDYVGSIFGLDSVPIKKSGLAIVEGDAIGQVGYDIPNSAVWDDVISGNQPFPKVVGDTGTIVVPKNRVTDIPDTNTVEFPADTPVTDSQPTVDNPSNPYPETTPEDVHENQGGEYYPNAIDLTQFFPFCIPFDIIYLVQQFNVAPETPVIEMTIPYPTALQSSLGSAGYEVEIDFNDYVSLRNIIRIFILLLFIAGLMKITRSLIRG